MGGGEDNNKIGVKGAMSSNPCVLRGAHRKKGPRWGEGRGVNIPHLWTRICKGQMDRGMCAGMERGGVVEGAVRVNSA